MAKMTPFYRAIVILYIYSTSHILSDVILQPIECYNVQGTKAEVSKQNSVATCASDSLLTGCSAIPDNANFGMNDEIAGSDIQNGNQCVSKSYYKFGSILHNGVRAHARCCKFNQYPSSFINTYYSALSAAKDDAKATVSCAKSDEILIGCTGLSQGERFDGAYAGNGDLYSTETLNTCNAYNGEDGYSAKAVARCADTSLISDGYDLQCTQVWSAQGQMSVSCPTDYFMTSCNAFDYWQSFEQYMIVNNVCMVTGDTTPIASAICCRLSKATNNPSMDPTINPTIGPTKQPTQTTMNPTIDPTAHPSMIPTNDPTLVPSMQPTTEPSNEPTVYPTVLPTDDPTFDPTLDPTTKPTQNPSNIPTLQPTKYPTTANPTINAVAGSTTHKPTPSLSTASTSKFSTDKDTETETKDVEMVSKTQNNKTNIIVIMSIFCVVLLFCLSVVCFLMLRKRKKKKNNEDIGNVVHIKIPKNIQMVASNSPITMNEDMLDQQIDIDEGTGTIGTCTGTMDDTNSSNHITFGNYLDDEYKIGDDEFVVEDDEDIIGVSTPGTFNNGILMSGAEAEDMILIEGNEENSEGRKDSMESMNDDEVLDEINSDFVRVTAGMNMDEEDEHIIDDIAKTPL